MHNFGVNLHNNERYKRALFRTCWLDPTVYVADGTYLCTLYRIDHLTAQELRLADFEYRGTLRRRNFANAVDGNGCARIFVEALMIIDSTVLGLNDGGMREAARLRCSVLLALVAHLTAAKEGMIRKLRNELHAVTTH